MDSKVVVPVEGQKITLDAEGKLVVPNNPVIPYIEGDGIGIDVTPAMLTVVNAAVRKAYGGDREIHWMEVYAGEKATQVYDGETWLPDETLDIFKTYKVGIKGPLTWFLFSRTSSRYLVPRRSFQPFSSIFSKIFTRFSLASRSK